MLFFSFNQSLVNGSPCIGYYVCIVSYKNTVLLRKINWELIILIFYTTEIFAISKRHPFVISCITLPLTLKLMYIFPVFLEVKILGAMAFIFFSNINGLYSSSLLISSLGNSYFTANQQEVTSKRVIPLLLSFSSGIFFSGKIILTRPVSPHSEPIHFWLKKYFDHS